MNRLRYALAQLLFPIVLALVFILAILAACGAEPAGPPPCIWPDDFKPIPVSPQDTIWYCIKLSADVKGMAP